MPLNSRNEAVGQLAERLAVARRVIKTEAVRMTLESELRHLDEATRLRQCLRPLQERVLRRRTISLEAGKAICDELSGNP